MHVNGFKLQLNPSVLNCSC